MTKATGDEMVIHELICLGDQLALSKLILSTGEKIISSLKKKYVSVYKKDKNLIIEAVNQALFDYYKQPRAFNPEKSSLQTYLSMAAARDLINILEKEKKYSELLKNIPNDVELEENFWNNEVVTLDNPESQTIEDEIFQSLNKLLSTYFKTQQDQELALLVFQGERQTEKFSQILKINHLPKKEKEKVVKQHKDRIKKIFERHDLEQKIKQVYER